MPHLKLFCDPQPDYYYFASDIQNHVQKGEENWLALLPVNRAVRLFTRKLIPLAKRQILSAPPVFTFDKLLLDFYNKSDAAKIVVSSELMGFLIEEILKKVSGQFTFFPRSANPPQRLTKKVTRMIDELRRFGYSAEELRTQDAQALEMETAKHHDFVLILETLEKILGAQYLDLPHALHQAATQLDYDSFVEAYPQIDSIYISGYGLFTPAMNLFIEKVHKWLSVSIKLEYSPVNDALFGHTRPAFLRFKEMGATVLEKENSGLATKLFNRERRSSLFNAQDSIRHSFYDNRAEEVVNIARQIHALQPATRLDKMAVTFSPLETYVPLIRKVFSAYGIPFNLSTGFPLRQSPLVSTVLNLVDMVQEKFEYSRVFQVIQSPFVKKSHPTYSVLFKQIVKKRIRHLTPGWQELLAGRLQQSDDKVPESLSEQIVSLNNFLQAAYQFSAQARPVLKFKDALLQMLEACGFLQWYNCDSSALSLQQKEREYRAYNRFRKILDQFSWSMQTLFGDKEVDLKTWLQHLRSAVHSAVYNLTEWPQNAVQIMPRLEIQATGYDVLFLGGLVDGDFPRAAGADIFFSDATRAKMGLVASEDLLSQDRFMFYSLLATAKSKTYLSTPRFSGEKALVPSVFLDDLQESCQIEIDADSRETDRIVSRPLLWEMYGTAIQEMDYEKSLQIQQQLATTTSDAPIHDVLKKITIQRERLLLNKKTSAYEGNMRAHRSVEQAVKSRYSNHRWSISQLEDYAFCPMQFFLKRVLRLEENPAFDEEVSPLERGNTIHKALFAFFSALRERGALQNPQKHLGLLEEIVREELGRLPFEGFFWQLELMRYFGTKDQPGLLQTFLDLEQQEISRTGFIPAHFEFSFGSRHDRSVDPASVDNFLWLEDADGQRMRINGKIDRIDIDPKTRHAVVFDYKTGKVQGKNASPITRGLSYQLPIYILAVEQLLESGYEVVYGGYYQLKDAQNCKRDGGIADPERYSFLEKKSVAALPNRYSKQDNKQLTYDELIEFARTQALKKHKELLNAQFTHTRVPDDQMCKSFCDYKRMCQKYVVKLKDNKAHQENQ